MKTTTPPPQLAPPGAGIPWLEEKILSLAVHLKCRLTPREAVAREFLAEHDRVTKIVRSCPVELAGQPVLVPRSSGLEDSSRFWSVWMTLDHLRIVNESIAGIITALGRNAPLPRPASTAEVKPSRLADAGVMANFEDSCELVVQSEAALAHPNTVRQFAHPWFGPLDAHGWHTMAAIHLGLHRKQLERIVAKLTK